MAYFDNAATSFPKPESVYSFMDSFYRTCDGSYGRGKNGLGALVKETRFLLQKILHCDSKAVVFTPSATVALNIVIHGLINRVKNVYVSPFEHNAVMRSLWHFQKKGIVSIRLLDVNKDFSYDFNKIKKQFNCVKPDLVVVSHASNVFGLISPIEEIFSLSKKYQSINILDMSQSAGLVECNVGSTDIDVAVFAGHKTLYGPTGISGFVMSEQLDIEPVFFGGTGFDSANEDMPSDIPQKFEFGTMNVAGLAGLNASLKWILDYGVEKLYQEENLMRTRLVEMLKNYNEIKLVGDFQGQKYVGIVSCLINGISSDTAGSIFAEQGVKIRSGLQCAPLAHKFAGTFPSGTIRFSINHFTKDCDFVELKHALDYINSCL